MLSDVFCSTVPTDNYPQISAIVGAMKRNTGTNHSQRTTQARALSHIHCPGLQVLCWDGSSSPSLCRTPPYWNMTFTCSWSFALIFNSIGPSYLNYTTVFQPNIPQSLPASVAIIHSAFKQSDSKVHSPPTLLTAAAHACLQISMQTLPYKQPRFDFNSG
jgi:hypothetical protein